MDLWACFDVPSFSSLSSFSSCDFFVAFGLFFLGGWRMRPVMMLVSRTKAAQQGRQGNETKRTHAQRRNRPRMAGPPFVSRIRRDIKGNQIIPDLLFFSRPGLEDSGLRTRRPAILIHTCSLPGP